ncbi:MAG: Txe/YoeB family addiction module toxin [Kiritimatiellaeota bacterium]|nr:Txe/YoeB family addiction module toxin [Kiritimatiellota bacterium]
MKITFSKEGWADYQWWMMNDNKKAFRRLNKLFDDILRNGYAGIGKAEPLKGNLSGFWSRRIDDEHRIIYRIVNDTVEISSCKDHY